MKIFLIITLILFSFGNVFAQKDTMMIRISEIEIDSNYVEEYNSILNPLQLEQFLSIFK